MSNEFIFLFPLWIIIFGALLILLVEMFFHEKGRDLLPYVTFLFLIIALISIIRNYVMIPEYDHSIELFHNTVKIESISYLFLLGVVFSGMLSVLFSQQYLIDHKAVTGEYYALILFVLAGMINVIVANELLTFFVGLELMSIGSYVLAGYFRVREQSIEAAVKYYLPGVFATGIILMGIAFIYGIAGTTFFSEIQKILPLRISSLYTFYLGVILFLVGLGFKIALVPFHAYAPDLYEGSSAPISAFLSTGVKVAAFFALLRFMGEVLQLPGNWLNLIPVLSILTMFLGNILALSQNNVKRMLAYSSIAHAGYVLIALVALDSVPVKEIFFAVGFYLLAYTFMTAGAFGLLGWLSRKEEKFVHLDDLAGISSQYPWVSFIMAIFMFSLAGFPPTAGFFGKYYVFRLAIANDYVWLAIIGIFNSFMSAYYYLRVIIYMFMKKEQKIELTSLQYTFRLAIIISVAGTLLIGFIPF